MTANRLADHGMVMADVVPAMIWVADPRGLRTYFNRAWLEFTGRTLAQELGDGWIEGVHPEDLPDCMHTYRSAMQSGRPFKMEYRLRRADGEFRWVLSYGAPGFDDQGDLQGYAGSCVDITDRKGSDVVSARLAAIVQSSDDAVVVKDLNGHITNWNSGAERIFGYTEQEVLGKPIAIIIPQELQGEEKDILRRLKAGERIEHFETVRVTKDGRKVLVSLTISPVKDSNGRIVAASKVARDITRAKQAEQALREAHELLDARVKERTAELDRAQERLRMLTGRLLRMQDDERRRIARELHDTAGQLLVALNLTLVPVETELLKREDPGLAAQITESLRLIDELSRDLRTMSHLLHPPLLDEAGLHSAVRWYVEGFAERSKIQVSLQLDPRVGRLPAEFETAIFRIVQECLTNIHRHSGSRSASIVIARDPQNVKIEICDHGKGMSTPNPRSGVGIQGMRERVRQLGGLLEIDSGSSGTRVTAIFPYQGASVEAPHESFNLAS